MTTRLWISRTEPAASRSAAAWAKAGFDPIVAPLLTIDAIPVCETIPEDADLVFTSAHGVFHCRLPGDDRRVYAVGDRTAEAARAAGFKDIVSADGDWTALLRAIERSERPIIHLSGEVVRGTLIESLREEGRDARRIAVYRSVPVKSWPLDPGALDAVALYSPLASETLMSLPGRDLSHLSASCLSDNVAEPLSGFQSVHIAARPTESALIACSGRAGR